VRPQQEKKQRRMGKTYVAEIGQLELGNAEASDLHTVLEHLNHFNIEMTLLRTQTATRNKGKTEEKGEGKERKKETKTRERRKASNLLPSLES
jgi:hypothetical protein